MSCAAPGPALALDATGHRIALYNATSGGTILWSPGGAMRKIITLIRAHGLLNRAHGLVIRAHDLVIRAHGLVIRAHGLARLNNYFPHGTAGAPYLLATYR